MKHQVSKRDASVELMRIIACFFVIFIHLGVVSFMNNSFSASSAFLACLFSDAVAIFWFITGAFLFQRDNYGKLIKGTIKKVFLPALALIVFIFLFDGWMFNNQSILESIKTSIQYIPNALECTFLWWATPVAHTGQLWYIFSYIFVMICFPLIKAFVDRIDKTHKEKSFLLISFGILLLNDFANNQFAHFNHSVIGALVPAIILIIWGHIFYKNKDKILKKFKSRYFLLAFFALVILRTIMLALNYELGDGNLDRSILYWFSCFSLLTVTSIFLFLEGTPKKITKNKLINWLILKTASYTFLIYLLHELTIDFLKKSNTFSTIQDYFMSGGNPLKAIAYYVVVGGTVFLFCLIISILLRTISKLSKKCYKLCFTRLSKTRNKDSMI